jgi:hypothetical protein
MVRWLNSVGSIFYVPYNPVPGNFLSNLRRVCKLFCVAELQFVASCMTLPIRLGLTSLDN